MIRVELPFHLRNLVRLSGDEVLLEVPSPPTLGALLDSLEALHPVLRGTIRDPATRKRRPFLRFFACRRDLSNEGLDVTLPDPVIRGEEPLLIVGAIAGG